ncbi:MAG: amino acid transporter substrate-binding protein [Myxococcales bacterium]|nr:amino acid transporter substrate-binding protein [Myxococcales bacterium]
MRRALAAALLALLFAAAGCHSARPLAVGSKKFTESVLLGELATRLIADGGVAVRHEAQLGGTRVLWDALLAGRIDVYPEYTGTLCQELLHSACDRATLERALAERHLVMTPSLGFADGYALAARSEVAARLHLARISDLAAHPELRLGFSEEFMARGDGWPALRARYRLPHKDVRGMDHDLAWRGLDAGTLDVIDAYSTDAEIGYYRPTLLTDDLGHFTEYQAVLIHRDTLLPAARAALARLFGAITASEMIAMNARAKRDKVPEARIAADFAAAHFGLAAVTAPDGVALRVWRRTVEHLTLVALSVAAAIVVGIPLGIVAARRRRLRRIILGGSGLLQTIPSLALLVFMIPLFGIGTAPALVALVVYSLLPIVRNTVAGIDGIAPPLRESAAALGLTSWERLRLVELPLAMPSILAGVQTAAVIAVGTATLGALIGAGGYGQPILTGIRLDDTRLILEGAVPAALLALLVQGLFDGVERLLVSRGLRLRPRADA